MQQSPIITAQESSQYSFNLGNETSSSLNQYKKQHKQLQQSPASSIGSVKASPPIYHSPQINNTKQKQSKFLNEAGFSPAFKNRILTQTSSSTILSRESYVKSNSLFKQAENQKDSPNIIESERRVTQRQGILQINKNSQPNIIQNNFDMFLTQRQKKKEGVLLPQIESASSIQKVKNKLSLLEDKQSSFFNEVNKFSRKSFASTQQAIIDSPKYNAQIPEGPSITLINTNTNLEITSLNEFTGQPSLTSLQKTSVKSSTLNGKNSQINPSIFLGNNQQEKSKEGFSSLKFEEAKSTWMLSPLKIPSISTTASATSASQLGYYNAMSAQCKKIDQADSYQSISQFSQTQQKDSPTKRSPFIFKYPVQDQSSLTVFENLDGALSNQNKQSNENKESTEINSSQTFSSQEDCQQIQICQIVTVPKKRRIVIPIRKMSQCDSVESKLYFSPQINQQATMRRRQTQQLNCLGKTMSRQIDQLRATDTITSTNTDKEDQFQSFKQYKSDRLMNLFSQNNSMETISELAPSSKNLNNQNKATLLREFYYLLSDIKKYVTDEIEKDLTLKQDIHQFYMIKEMNEFSFHFGYFLDHLAEQRQLTEQTFPYKFPSKIFGKITGFMFEYISKQPQNSEQMLKLLDEQIQKAMPIINPSTLLEALGGYCKVRSISEQITKLLYTSALSNHLIIHSEKLAANNIEKFLLSALNGETDKTKKMIEEFKKYSGAAFTSTEFYVLKQILFTFFSQHSYYVDEVKYAFFELLESFRYQVTQEEEFSKTFLDLKQDTLLKEFAFIWKQDPILSKMKEISKNSINQFIQVLFDYIFSQKNCYQLSKAFSDNFVSGKIDILVVKSLHQVVKVATKRHNINQQQIQMQFNYLFKKMQWFISTNNDNYVQVVGDSNQIGLQLQYMILNQKVNNQQTSSPSKESFTQFNDIEKGNKSPTQIKNKFKLLQQQKSNFSQKQSQQQQQNSQILFDITNFTQFLSLFFNFNTTYHYADLICFYKSERSEIQIFKFWIQLFGECLIETRNVSASTANEIKKFIQDLFEFQQNKQKY